MLGSNYLGSSYLGQAYAAPLGLPGWVQESQFGSGQVFEQYAALHTAGAYSGHVQATLNGIGAYNRLRTPMSGESGKIVVTPGKTYEFTADYYTFVDVSAYDALIGIFWLDASGNQVDYDQVHINQLAPNVWQSIGVSGLAPATAVYASIWIDQEGSGFTSNFLADNVVLVEVPLAVQTPVSDSNGPTTETATATVAYSFAETGAGTDAATRTISAIIADTGSGTDALTVKAQVSATDTGVGTDPTNVGTASVSVTDSGAGTETPAPALTAKVATVSETTTVTETVSLAPTFVAADSNSLVTETLVVSALSSIADNGAGTDAPNIGAASAPISDSGAGSDSFAITITNAVNFSDSGAGTENFSVTVKSPVADSNLTPVEVFTAGAAIPISDTSIGTDAYTNTSVSSTSDSGSGNESLTLAGKLAFSDASAGSDTFTVIARVPIGDSATSSDTGTLSSRVTAVDLATSDDDTVTTARMLVADSSTSTDDDIRLILVFSEEAVGTDVAASRIITSGDFPGLMTLKEFEAGSLRLSVVTNSKLRLSEKSAGEVRLAEYKAQIRLNEYDRERIVLVNV